MNFKQMAANAKIFLSNNSPTILTGMSIVGLVSTAIMASQATVKAVDTIDDFIEDTDRLPEPKEVAQMVWKYYIPTALMGTTSIACIVGSHVCSTKQKEVLQSAYLLSQTTLQEYQKRVIERIGERKEKEVYNETIKAVAEKQSPAALYSDGGMAGEVIDTGKGNTLFYDVPGQQYFKSDINYIRSQVNDLNFEVRTEMFFDWNEIYYRWGLPLRKYGSEMIFDVDHPLDIRLNPEMMDNGQVRILIDYDLIPRTTERGWH